MDMEAPKCKKPMNKDEVSYFVDLIQNYGVLISKETNAATNKLKEDAWVSLTAVYNAKCGSIPKHKDQLKLKWDNLKKAARKRSTQIRMNNLKTGGGKADFIPPDETLEKVANILGATCTGFMVPFGGDGIGGEDSVIEVEVATEIPDMDPTPNTSGAKKRKVTIEDDTSECNAGAQFLYGMPTMAKSLQSNGKRRKIVEDGRLERNLAIANYYNKKAEKVDWEIKLLKLQVSDQERNVKN